MGKASENKWLIVKSGVILTPIIEPVIARLDSYFEKHKHIAYVTSGLRTPEDQLRIIRKYLVSTGLNKIYPEAMTCDLDSKFLWQGKVVYRWQPGWSALLNRGIIINPAREAVCLMDYIRDGKNKKGQTIKETPHSRGVSFDVSDGKEGISKETEILQEALNDKVQGLVYILPEHNNGCVHCDAR
jgi:hypothetical protein